VSFGGSDDSRGGCRRGGRGRSQHELEGVTGPDASDILVIAHQDVGQLPDLENLVFLRLEIVFGVEDIDEFSERLDR